MGQIVKFPVQAAKFGYKRVKKRAQAADDPDQLHLFAGPTAQILSLGPELGWFEQALRLDERGDPRAAELYAKAIAENDCVADAHCNLGIIESLKSNTIKAFACFTTALKHNPRHTEAHFNLGNLYFDVNDFRLAQIHYEMAGDVDPTFANVYFNLALVRAINNDLASAIQALSQYQRLVPEKEARNVDDFLRHLKESVAASGSSPSGSEATP